MSAGALEGTWRRKGLFILVRCVFSLSSCRVWQPVVQGTPSGQSSLTPRGRFPIVPVPLIVSRWWLSTPTSPSPTPPLPRHAWQGKFPVTPGGMNLSKLLNPLDYSQTLSSEVWISVLGGWVLFQISSFFEGSISALGV